MIEHNTGASRVFNVNETAIKTTPEHKQVLAEGLTNVWDKDVTVKTNFHLSFVACGSASGFVVPLVTYQAPCTITEPPPRSNGDAYQAWKHDLWELSLALDRTANERLRGYDGKKPTTKPRRFASAGEPCEYPIQPRTKYLVRNT
ncbi:hypothetical protein PR003_g19037 [Phytophthora rubi]|uniref:Uncharacterized protein n=1 Tax=Phytophthora rubi TaxID=129364 RepID=A0A6A3K658_9STRA|nr:hypothetical protein PR002_g18407 [Phytophthora rubi]KAE9002976.1 hypothetical protein PR001_g18102 [Phytophthora rubi]KAE9315247.1 hypothetical protein PR003_g19037 [Phytophthora rubi]